MIKKEITKRLEAIRKSIKDEGISYSEIAELQSLAKYIEPGDVELLEWAGVKEKEYQNNFDNVGMCPHCNSIELDYSSIDIDGESVYYPFVCAKCGCEGREYYNLEFDQITVNG